ncbi:MAG: hypothetical protein QOJ17_5608 [Rhodospirillaceae bacterium]|nr:hypothetical protein [Rhodospirillaceae bacterium]
MNRATLARDDSRMLSKMVSVGAANNGRRTKARSTAETGRRSPANGRSRRYFAAAAAAPALATSASWLLITPEAPMAPTILPSTTIGTPPSSGVTPG